MDLQVNGDWEEASKVRKDMENTTQVALLTHILSSIQLHSRVSFNTTIIGNEAYYSIQASC